MLAFQEEVFSGNVAVMTTASSMPISAKLCCIKSGVVCFSSSAAANLGVPVDRFPGAFLPDFCLPFLPVFYLLVMSHKPSLRPKDHFFCGSCLKSKP